jgi:hypothetical protein
VMVIASFNSSTISADRCLRGTVPLTRGGINIMQGDVESTRHVMYIFRLSGRSLNSMEFGVIIHIESKLIGDNDTLRVLDQGCSVAVSFGFDLQCMPRDRGTKPKTQQKFLAKTNLCCVRYLVTDPPERRKDAPSFPGKPINDDPVIRTHFARILAQHQPSGLENPTQFVELL